MKIKFTTKVVVPPREKPVEVETSFEFETDLFEEEEETKPGSSFEEISNTLDDGDIEDKEHEGEDKMPQMGFVATNERRRKKKAQPISKNHT